MKMHWKGGRLPPSPTAVANALSRQEAPRAVARDKPARQGRPLVLHSRLLGRTGAFAQARPPAKQARRTGEAGGQNPKSKILINQPLPPILILCFAIILSIFSPKGISQAGDKLVVYVVNYPLKYFAERIGGNHVKVVFPAPADEDPAYWMPDAKTITDYQRADLIMLNGANYAKWASKVSLPRFRLVNTSATFKDRYIVTAEVLTHSHGPEGKHAHESLAFTTWMDLELAAMQAKAIKDALTRKIPKQKDAFQKNYKALEKDLIALDRDIKSVVSKDPSKALLVSHPVYDYFARRYGLNIKSVHWEPDEMPSAGQWSREKRSVRCRYTDVGILLTRVEPGFCSRQHRLLAAPGGPPRRPHPPQPAIEGPEQPDHDGQRGEVEGHQLQPAPARLRPGRPCAQRHRQRVGRQPQDGGSDCERIGYGTGRLECGEGSQQGRRHAMQMQQIVAQVENRLVALCWLLG